MPNPLWANDGMAFDLGRQADIGDGMAASGADPVDRSLLRNGTGGAQGYRDT